ncbi:hypothetical protein IFM89_032950 [Coptis chinensis]|uniref:Uncharacterized protein n=1 Tax=Coptis chinensis TaxID=261450 RepID=A0A835I4N3_9MAGN|nr:hypothetical protein IFM89_032950 [Coptis chinensis]
MSCMDKPPKKKRSPNSKTSKRPSPNLKISKRSKSSHLRDKQTYSTMDGHSFTTLGDNDLQCPFSVVAPSNQLHQFNQGSLMLGQLGRSVDNQYYVANSDAYHQRTTILSQSPHYELSLSVILSERSTVICAIVMSVTLVLHVSTGALAVQVVTIAIRLTRRKHGGNRENVSNKGKWHKYHHQNIMRLLPQWHQPHIQR